MLVTKWIKKRILKINNIWEEKIIPKRITDKWGKWKELRGWECVI